MRERQKQILRYLLNSEKIILIDHLADKFSIGRRTVSRDLDVIEKWLSLRGARLQRKQNLGIQVLSFSNSTHQLLEILNRPDEHIDTLTPKIRQQQMLIYLLYNNREVKITELANAFFISDTSVWNDLNQIETNISDYKFSMERLKGVGIRLSGKEVSIRLCFLKQMTKTFSSKTIIPYLYQHKEDINSSLEVNQLRLFMKRMNIPQNSDRINEIMKNLPELLGYNLTMSSEAILFYYLHLTLHRIKSGAIIEHEKEVSTSKFFYNISHSILELLTNGVYSGNLPEGEIIILGFLLQILEIGDYGSIKPQYFKSIITKSVKKSTREIIKEFGLVDDRLYYLNEHIESVLNLTLATLILRLKYKVPYWHGEWGNPNSEDWKRDKKVEVLSKIIESEFGLTPTSADLDNLLLHFHSLILNKSDIPRPRYRALVCCFEGIGLASYLHTLLQRELPNIVIVEATAVYKVTQQYIEENDIEVVISTFSISNIDVPVIPISLPLNKRELVESINVKLRDLNIKQSDKPFLNSENITGTLNNLTFDNVLEFIQNFKMFNFPDVNDLKIIIDLLSKELTGNSEDYNELAISFKKREDLGPLYFEEYGVRVLHCKTLATTKPLAGIITFKNDETKRMIYLVAPNPCPDNYRKLLSTITISFINNLQFRTSVMSGDMNQIRKNLMNIYKELI